MSTGAGHAVGTSPALDPATLRQVFAAFPTGVTALAALVGGEPVGMTASSFVSVSLDPPLVSVCAAYSSRTWPRLRHAPRLGVSVLGAAQETVGRRLSAPGDDRFSGLEWWHSPPGAVLFGGAGAWLDCSIEREVAAGDHVIVLLRVRATAVDPRVSPLVFHGSRYRRLTG